MCMCLPDKFPYEVCVAGEEGNSLGKEMDGQLEDPVISNSPLLA